MKDVDDLSHAELAVLGRELLLAGHLIDRAGMPQVIAELGADVMRDVAIQEWMGASPVYTRRTRELLGFDDEHDVSAIFKGMQFDIGAPHEFMDFRYEVHDSDHGEFHLAHCGALMDVEPMGESFVVAMCHHIEDPTFDATACATNPRARMRPVHRPPRLPADRHPHCHWTVSVEADAEPVPEPPAAERIARTEAARLPVAVLDASYQGPVDPDLRLERFDVSALRALADEFALQGHLLSLSFALAVQDVAGAEVANRITGRQFAGIAGLTASRLRDAFGMGSSLDDIATVIALHPAFRPRTYVALEVVVEDDSLVIRLTDCPALRERAVRGWIGVLDAGDHDALTAIARAVDPQAAVRPLGDRAWEILHDDTAPPAPECDEVMLTRFSTGADFSFQRP